jgi:hypothetical protein
VLCRTCNIEIKDILSSPRLDRKVELNERFTSGFVAMGLGSAAADTFAMNMNMPHLGKRAFIKNSKTVALKSLPVTEQCLADARRRVRDWHIANNPELKDVAVIDIIVSFDGSWQKRGHCSLFGFAAVIDSETGLIVDYIVLCKYCHDCRMTAADLGPESPEYHAWYMGHKDTCDINFDPNSPSGNMEVAAAKILWAR